jgi:TonB family protein
MLRVFAILLLSGSCALARPFATLPPDVSALATFIPQPEYPLAARQRRATGNGFFVLHVDRASGRVINVEVGRSTGDQLLDGAALKALRRFKPGGVLPTKHDPNTTKESKTRSACDIYDVTAWET